MSVGVSYLNSRKVIKVTPTQKLQAVLEEACEHFKLDASCCRLKKGKMAIDCSLPYRFSNLPNNTTLDLEVFTKTQVGAGSKLATSRIALNVNGKSLSSVFPVTHCLTDIISHFIKEGTCPDILEDVAKSCPEIIYLQSRFGVESFQTTTLSGLGLAGSSARLQLRFREEEKEVAVEKVAGIASESDRAEGQSTEGPATVFTKSESEVAPASIEGLVAEAQSPLSALKSMLEKNFDAVNKPAVIVLSKYLFNIFAHPDVEKYRTLFTDNKAFRDKVACAQGSMEFLACAGFGIGRVSGRPALVLPSFDSSAGAPEQRFKASCRALEQALAELQVPSEERPVLMTPEALSKARMEAAGALGGAGASTQEFNPYKTFVRRVADGSNGASVMPPGGSSADRKSATQERLEQLQKRRRELEGDLHSVTRNTRLYLPGAEYAPAKGDDGVKMDVDDDDGDDGRPDNRLLAQSLRGKLGSEDAPLTTAATRAVMRAQSETVYSKTAIKVRFPDKTTLTGMFHPRHRVRDIYDWVLDCLHAGLVSSWKATGADAGAGAGGGGGGGRKRSEQSLQTEYPFELYTAPPRTVLAVNVSQPGVYNRWEGEGEEDDSDDRESLSGRKLVPAAQIMVSWTSSVVESWIRDQASGGGAHTDTGAAGVAAYFDAALLEDAVTVDKAAAPAISASLFPSGRALVDASAKASSSSSSSSLSSSSPSFAARALDAGAEADSKGAGSAKKKKPSWFKL